MRVAAAALLWFALLCGLLHFTIEDPYRLYCEDIQRAFLPQTAYTYQHPWEAFAGRPTPSASFGTSNYLTDGRPAALLPFVAAALARVAPRDPWRLAVFEWRATSLYLLLSMAALFFFLRRCGVDGAIAAGVASSFPFAFTIFFEWRHTDLLRGRLMIAAVLYGLAVATRRGGWRGWLLLAGAIVLCMAQASQLYWVGILVAWWIAASAWIDRARLREIARLERSVALRRAAAPLAALAVVGLALAPIYLRGRHAVEGSAFFDELRNDPARVLFYLRDGRDWFTLADLPTLEHGFLPWSLAGTALLAAVALLARGRGAPGGGFAWTQDSRRLVVLGLPLFAASLLLAFVPHLPDAAFAVRGGRLEWSFLPLRVPAALPLLFHTTQRTWLVLAEIGATIAAAGALTAWSASRRSARERGAEAAAAVAVVAVAASIASWASTGHWLAAAHWRALAAAAAVLAATGLAAALAGAPRRAAQVAVIALGALFAAQASASHYEAGTYQCRDGELDAVAALERDEAVLERAPAELRHQRGHRVFGEKWCYWLDAPCTFSYGLRTLPADVLRFFRAIDAVRDVRLPYWLQLDYAMLLQSGIAQMIGIRWWILPAEVMDGGMPLTEGGRLPPLHLYEARDVFPKGWTLESWETVDSFDAAAARVVELGRAGELRRRGVAQTAGSSALRTSADTASQGSPSRAEVVSIEPGRLAFAVRGETPTLLATNEFFHPDWKARVDGAAAPVLRVNAAFVGVAVPAGEHAVTIER